MLVKFKCPDCEDSLMDLTEGENHECSKCGKSLTEEEASKLFEDGDLIAAIDEQDEEDDSEEDEDEEEEVTESEEEEDDSDEDEEEEVTESEEEDDDDEDEDEDEEDEEDMEESFNGFANKDTWAANLVLQHDYAAYKDVCRVVEDVNRLRKVAEKHLKDVVEDLDVINWPQVKKALEESQAEFKEITSDVVSVLSEGEEMPDEVKDKVVTVFEAAMMTKFNEYRSVLEEKAEVQLKEKMEAKEKELVEEIDGYVTGAVKEWANENELQLENGIRTEITASFMEGLADLLKTHYIDVPEDRYDLIEDMAEKIDYLEAQVNQLNEDKVNLQDALVENSRAKILAKVSGDLADTQVEKLSELAESVNYESDDQFEKKLVALKESFLKITKPRKSGEDPIVITEDDKQSKDNDRKVLDLNDPMERLKYSLNRKTNK